MPLEITNNLSSSRQMEFSDERVLIRLLSDRYMQISFYEVGVAVSISFRSRQYSWIKLMCKSVTPQLFQEFEGDF